MKKRYFQLNMFLLTCGMACLICYDIFGGLWLKGVTSSWFFILGCVNLRFNHRQYGRITLFPTLIVLGLFFGMCADVLLGVWFIGGILVFALGHVMYLLAFGNLDRFRLQDLWFILPASVISVMVVVGTPFIRVDDPFMKNLLIVYALIIAGMLGKAISNYRNCKSASRLLILIGSIMFWFSDVVLAIDIFGTSSRLTWILCSYVYWPAQHILAISLLYHGLQKKPQNHPISENASN